MPKLVDMLIDADPYEQDKYAKAAEFWANASAYAAQAAPYGVERMQELDNMADEINQGMSMLPPEAQAKLKKRLKSELVDPVENSTAQEFDSAWSKLQTISRALHTQLMPRMSQMGNMGMMNQNPMMDQGAMDMAQEEMPTGPHMMPDGTMMAGY